VATQTPSPCLTTWQLSFAQRKERLDLKPICKLVLYNEPSPRKLPIGYLCEVYVIVTKLPDTTEHDLTRKIAWQ
jgi:hypothetical protein